MSMENTKSRCESRCSLLAAVVVAASLVQEANGIKCWGGNAMRLQREVGEARSCTHGSTRWDLFRYDRPDVCYEKCAGVTWFEGFSNGNRPFTNPDGKHLCPGVVDKGEYVPRTRASSPLFHDPAGTQPAMHCLLFCFFVSGMPGGLRL